MKVWVVQDGGYSEGHIHGVFSSELAALTYIQSLGKFAEVNDLEFEVDKKLDILLEKI
jgi:hypothetical protein